ncbi:MAG TPA: inositol monophosphatase [Chloroflexota bacterium]|nr:inositol monophosphatase [Chloroflexota bacterium]
MRAETHAAVEAVRAALPLLRARQGADERHAKERLDFATGTDVAVERLLIERLSGAFPAYGILGEETGLQGDRDRFWVLDPICGTTNYAIGLPLYNVNVALIEDGLVTIGVVLDPVADEVYWAERGAGSFAPAGDGWRRLRTSDHSGTISIDFGHRTATGEVDLMHALMGRVLRQRFWNVRVLATSVVLAYVADGRLAAHVVDAINAWDLCAGALLAEEAGAIVTDFEGRPWKWDSPQVLCAASERTHAQLLELLAQR